MAKLRPYQEGTPLQQELFQSNSSAKFVTPEDVRHCSGKRVALDVESTSLHWWSGRLLGVGAHCPDADVAGYFPCPTLKDVEAVQAAVRSWAPNTVAIGHNVKFDLHFLGINPVTAGWKLIDTTVLVHLLDSRNLKRLEAASGKYLGEHSKQSFPGKKDRIWEWPLSEVAAYCTNDARLTYELAKKLLPLVREQGMLPLFQQQMIYLGHVWETERHGLATDPEFLQQAIVKMEADRASREVELFTKTNRPEGFNWRSNKQLSAALYEGMGIEKPKWEGGGGEQSRLRQETQYTDTATGTFLLMEKAHHPLGELVMDLREADKLHTTLEKWCELRDSGGRIHTSFNLTGTRTGRLSSSEPNFQNLPSDVRTRHTQAIYSGATSRAGEYNLRQAFLPSPGNVLVSLDYAQQEMRMFGALAGDENLLEVLRSGGDVHAGVAAAIWGESNKVNREHAKTVSFGLLYGLTSGSLQFHLNMTAEEARNIANQYWLAFPRVKPWMAEVIRSCKLDGYVTYWSSRRWYEDEEIKMYAAVNALVQGGSHDMLMVAVNRLAEFLARDYPEVHICNLVHDEIDLDMPPALLSELLPQVQKIAEVPDLLNLAFPTDVKVGKNYGKMEEWHKEGGQ